MSPFNSTRRAVLAACGSAMFAGCTDVLGSGSPSIECAPTEYAWPMYGFDPAGTGHAPARTIPPANAEARRLSRTGPNASSGGSVDAPPVVADGIAYVAGGARVETRDVETGERRWETDPDDNVAASPAFACDTLYVSTLNETLALDSEDGSVLWRADGGSYSGASASPVVADGTVYVPGGNVVALDAETGEERWRTGTDHSAHGLAVTDRVYVGAASNGDGEVAALTRDGGDWWRTEGTGSVYAAPAVDGDTVYAVSKTGLLTALAADDGSVRWQTSVEPGIHEPPAVADGCVVVGAGNGSHATAVDAATGDELWTFATGASMSAPVIVGEYALVAGANTGIYAVDVETGERVRHWSVPYVGSRPVVAEGLLFYRAWNVSDVFVVGDGS